MTVSIERSCSDERMHRDHPPHEWATYEHWWCPGWPRQPRPVTDALSERPCDATVTVGASAFVCTRTEHYSAPGGYGGTGHTWVSERADGAAPPETRTVLP